MSSNEEKHTKLPEMYEITKRIETLEERLESEEERINDIIAVITEMVDRL